MLTVTLKIIKSAISSAAKCAAAAHFAAAQWAIKLLTYDTCDEIFCRVRRVTD